MNKLSMKANGIATENRNLHEEDCSHCWPEFCRCSVYNENIYGNKVIWDHCDKPGGPCVHHEYTQGSPLKSGRADLQVFCRTLEAAAMGAPDYDIRQYEYDMKCIAYNEEHSPTQEEIDSLNAFYDDLIKYNAKFDD